MRTRDHRLCRIVFGNRGFIDDLRFAALVKHIQYQTSSTRTPTSRNLGRKPLYPGFEFIITTLSYVYQILGGKPSPQGPFYTLVICTAGCCPAYCALAPRSESLFKVPFMPPTKEACVQYIRRYLARAKPRVYSVSSAGKVALQESREIADHLEELMGERLRFPKFPLWYLAEMGRPLSEPH
jgi:hypothetical protein